MANQIESFKRSREKEIEKEVESGGARKGVIIWEPGDSTRCVARGALWPYMKELYR